MDVKPHTILLGLVEEAPFPMGRQLLAECVIGEESARIKRLQLDRLIHHSSLPLYQKKDVFDLIDQLLKKKFLRYTTVKSYMKVLELTPKGREELASPSQDINLSNTFEGHYSIEKVTEEDRNIFSKLPLENLSDEQKKAVIMDHPRLLCIAGAGSGKTRVLTKRAWFVSEFKSVPQEKILCITFTRKARMEMRKRLDRMLPNNRIKVHTFNSFCEKVLKTHEEEIYEKHYTVMTYSQKVRMIMDIIKGMDVTADKILKAYYTSRQYHSKEDRTLFLGFVNDIFSVLDYKRFNAMSRERLFKLIMSHEDQFLSRIITDILLKIDKMKKERGLRDFTDQLVHTINYYKTGNSPDFDHVLVDEYQDINSLQFELLQLLAPSNLFAVGDPRQAIYGWRGAVIDYILDFESLYPGAKVLQLTTNYRSSKDIVKLGNTVIKDMKLPDLIPRRQEGEAVTFLGHDNEDQESVFITHSIQSLDVPRKEIFVLARTNKQIEQLAKHLDRAGIKYLKRTVEEKNAHKLPRKDEITLSTIHAIKGLEAEVVYLIGANTKNHPIKAGEHPLLETIKINDTYDKFDEELRLFYVAVTRAKDRLIINYTGSLTSYVEGVNQAPKQKTNGSRLYEELRIWRAKEAKIFNIPAYQVFNNKTLQEICDVLPLDIRELHEINGFGPYKVRKWGEKIIELVNNYG